MFGSPADTVPCNSSATGLGIYDRRVAECQPMGLRRGCSWDCKYMLAFFFFFSIRCNVHEIYLHYLGLFQTIICNLPGTLHAKGLWKLHKLMWGDALAKVRGNSRQHLTPHKKTYSENLYDLISISYLRWDKEYNAQTKEQRELTTSAVY